MKHILITGENSYVGSSLEQWLLKSPQKYKVDTLDMKEETWKRKDFSQYDAVFHVAGIVHMTQENHSEDMRKKYYYVNTQLAFETAEKAKAEGVKQFIFMSSMSVYGNAECITIDTEPAPRNFYGDSKWKAEQAISVLEDTTFKIAILRPPMIYGRGAKGNYPILSKLSQKILFFPKIKNRRSMLYIENLCEFVRLVIDNEESGIFFPQDEQWVNTCDMVRKIAEVRGHHIWFMRALAPGVWLGRLLPGRAGQMCRKAFGNCYYDMKMSDYKDNYRLYGLKDAIERTER